MRDTVRCFNCFKGKFKKSHLGQPGLLKWIFVHEALINCTLPYTTCLHFDGQESFELLAFHNLEGIKQQIDSEEQR